MSNETIQERLRTWSGTWDTAPAILIREAATLLDTQAAEIERLRALVESGYEDGFLSGIYERQRDEYANIHDGAACWGVSDTRAALNPKETSEP